MPAGNLELKAKWKINQYTITFNTEGGSEVASITQDYGTAIIAPEAPTREGYTFTGWEPELPTTMPAENVTITATWTINQYTITFNTDGGSSIAPITADYGAAITAPAAPTREGYTFTGWDREIPATMPASDLTITAQWEVNKYTITYMVDGEIYGEVETYDFGTEISIRPEPIKEGYTFSGWNIEEFPSKMPANNLEINGTFTINSYTITFDSAGGSEVASITQDYGTAIIAPEAPTREGYTFTGWEPELPTTMPAENVTITATWTINQYTITFNTDGGSSIAPITADYGTAIIAPEAPTREGYTFTGWDREIPATMPAENVTITATWTINQYTITFNTDGGSSIAPITADYGAAITAPAAPTREGYTFTGWDREIPATMPASDLTITAQWEVNKYTITYMVDGEIYGEVETYDFGTEISIRPEPIKEGYTFSGWNIEEFPSKMPANNLEINGTFTINSYTITFDSAGGSEVASITQDYGTAIIAPEAPTREGYTFTGWEPELPTTMPAENVTITATWTINQYTITFNTDGGSSIAPITADYGAAITAPAAPTREGYTFTGWDREIPATMPASDLTITAQWEVNKYTITYMVDGEIYGEVETYDFGTEISIRPEPIKEGYTFSGWNIEEFPSKMPANNLEINGTFTINSYTITFDSAGGSEVASITQDYGTAIIAPEAPTREGYTFTGWEPELPTTMPAENVTITATWTINQYTITFNTDGGSSIAPITADYGTAIIAPEAPTREGYTFTGWDREIPATMPASDLTITAQWEVNKYTITYMVDGEIYGEVETYDFGTEISIRPEPIKEGYTFSGWNIEEFPSKMPANNLEINGTFTINSYTITFDSAGGSEVASITQDYGTAIIAPEAPTREGYTFTGWEPELPTTMPAENVTITATWTINQYTITFNTDGGSSIAPITADYGAAITAPAAPTREGYTFTGWDREIPATMPASDLTITAQWEVNKYTITYMVDGEIYGEVETYDFGTEISIRPEPIKEGYTFSGWNIEEFPSKMPANNLEINGTFTINSYTITFDSAGGSEVASITQDYGTAIIAPEAPTREGYTFTGWEPELPTTMPAENVTITATWTINQYTITFNTDGGSSIAPITADYGTAIIAPEAPTREGYTFTGWEPELPTTMPAENVTITATWTINQYTITFNTDGGSSIAPITADYGTAIIAPEAPTREGYTFTGWDREIPATMPASDLTITAQWEVNKYTITYMVDGEIYGEVETYDFGTEISIRPEPIKEGYTFSGWNIEEFPSKMPANNLEINGTFTINSYTITFDSAGGSEVASITQDYGTAIIAPEAPTREGYTFTGWEPELPTTMPAENVTITATWTINQYTITFNTDGGSSIAPITADYGAAITAPAAPTREGYTFTGWDREIPATMPASDLTITAQWEVNKYTITYMVDGEIYGEVETYDFGTEISIRPEPIKEGYTFSGWNIEEFPSKMPANNLEINGTFTINSYTITFDSAGGSEVASITQDYGTAIIAPEAPTREGYTFTGWEPELPTTMPAENVTITATWTINQYTITFNTDGGSSIAPITADYGTAIIAPEAPTREGYTFTGWEPELPTTMPAENVTITATWTINQYTITFNTDGGSSIAPITADYGTAIIAPEAPTREGYTFTGWDREIPATMPASDLTITAQWEVNKYTITYMVDGEIYGEVETYDFGTEISIRPEPIKEGYTFSGWNIEEFPSKMPANNLEINGTFTINSYTITFDSAGGSEVASITQDYGTAIIAPEAPTREGYTFTGWEPELPTTMPAENVTITATWTINQYTITFNTDGGSSIAPITADYGTAIIAPEAPTREGYTFTGWDREIPATMPASDLTITAQWEVNKYTITYMVDGEIYGEVETYDFGTEISIRPEPIKEGYTFSGWNIEEFPSKMPANNLEINGTFTINSYTITFDSAGGSEVASITQDYGTAIIAPEAPTREGYTFTGWEPELPTTMPAENVTITATWTINQYIVTFVDHDGTVIDIQTVEHGGSATAPAANPEREGYTFTGWDVAFNNVTENLTVKAQYEIKTYTVSFVDTNAVDLTEATIEVWNSNNELIADLTKVANGAYSYKISLDGYVPLTGSFTIADADKEVELTLLAAVAVIGDTYYADLVTALDNATSGTTVVLLKDHTLSENATVKSGVTLLLPYSSEFSTTTDDTGSGALTRNRPYVELTIPENINLNIAGTLTVNAKRTNSSTTYSGHVTGANYAQLHLKENSKITVNSGGILNSIGFIYGDGSIEAEDGSKVYEPIFVKSFRGGQATLKVYGDVFPFDQYTVNNIEADMIINKGAEYIGKALLYANSTYFHTPVPLIGNSTDSLLFLSNGRVIKTYDHKLGTEELSTGRVFFDVQGDASFNNIGVSLKYGFLTINANSVDKDLPFDGTWSFNVASGHTLTVNSWVMLLPGASINIEDGATMNISESGKVTVLDKHYEDLDPKKYNSYPNPAEKYYRTDTEFDFMSEGTPASFTVDGNLIVNGSITGKIDIGDTASIFASNAVTTHTIKYVVDTTGSATVKNQVVNFIGLFASTNKSEAQVGDEVEITTIVRDQDGNTLEGVGVTFSGGSDNWTASATTNTNGEATATYIVKANDYEITTFEVAAGDETFRVNIIVNKGISITLEAQKTTIDDEGTTTVTATVLDYSSGQAIPVVGVEVEFSDNGGGGTWQGGNRVTTNENGVAVANYEGVGNENGSGQKDVKLTATYDGKVGETSIKVNEKPPEGLCVADGTLITLADGSQKPVEELTGDELLLVWNLHTGKFDIAPIAFIDSDPLAEYKIIHLHFSDGTDVKVIYEHGFWNFNLNEYVYINGDNPQQYIGHWFKKQITDADGNLTWTKVQLVDVVFEYEYTRAWSPVTYEHLSYYTNGMLSMPGGIEGLINIFEVSPDTIKIDEDAYLADIAEYGLFTYEEFTQIINVPAEMFDAFQAKYFKVAIGKGHITMEELLALILHYGDLLGLE
ncbi:MAG: InlB B-repeat-containing protein [Anaerovoracaceae bacterium]